MRNSGGQAFRCEYIFARARRPVRRLRLM